MINYKNMHLWPELRRPLFVAASVLYESLQPSALPFAYPSNLSFGGPISLTNHAYLCWLFNAALVVLEQPSCYRMFG
jgi:hypothetical protein